MMSSPVWNYFSKTIDVSKAKCKLCNKLVSRGGTSSKTATTTNLVSHLKIHHPEQHSLISSSKKLVKEPLQQSQPVLPSCTQLTILESIERKKSLPKDHPRSQEITRKISEFLAMDYQPFSTVENDGFRRLVTYLEPRYEMPSRYYFRENVHPNMLKRIQNIVREKMSSAAIISFTSDVWTSSANTDSFLSLTAHFINEEFIQNNVVLGVRHCPGSHTAANLSEIILRVFDFWEIETNCVHAIVTDNGANMVRAVKDLDVNQISCFAHSLQLVIKDSLFSQKTISDSLKIARNLVGHFKHSQLPNNQLKQIQEELSIPQHRLIQDVVTRWNSSFYMLERCLEQKAALINYAQENHVNCFTPEQWSLIEKVIVLLKPFEVLTREASKTDETASLLIPAVYALDKFLSSGDRDTFSGVLVLKNEMNDKLLQRFENLESNKLLVLATILDPRYKNKAFRFNDTVRKSEEWLKILIEERRFGLEEQSPVIETASKRVKIASDIWECLEEMESINTICGTSGSQDNSELQTYLLEKLLPRDSNIFIWWNQNRVRFPILFRLAISFLSCPPSSVASERLFSVAGKILTKERHRLKPQVVEDLAFIKGNFELWNFSY